MSARTDVLLWANRVLTRRGSPPHVLLEITEHATPKEVQEAFHRVARTSHPDLHRHGLNAEELELVTSAYAAVAGAYQQMRSQVMLTQRMRPIKPGEDFSSFTPAQPRAVTPPQGAKTPTPPSGAPASKRPDSDSGVKTVPAGPRHPRAGTGSDAPGRQFPRAGTGSDPAGRAYPRAGTDADGPTPKPASVKATGSQPPAGTQSGSQSGSRSGAGSQPPGSTQGGVLPVSPGGPATDPTKAMSSKALLYYRKAELCLKRGDLKGAILQLKLACATDPTSSFLRTALAEVETEVRKGP